MGRPAYFVRTFGCPVKCSWCDSAGTWHPDWIPDKIARREEQELLDEALKTGAQFVVVTGGEPAIHDLEPLTDIFRRAAYRTHLETSGAYPVKGRFDWITLSPKWAKMPLTENLNRAQEVKIIVEDEASIERWWDAIGKEVHASHVWLHPEWSQRSNPAVLNSISNWIKEKSRHGTSFRAGYQIHRLYNVDKLDQRSQPEVPLGGKHS